MTLPQKTAAIFGGTGFIGRYIVRELTRAGYAVKIATRIPERAYFLRPCGTVGQVVPMQCDYNEQQSIDTIVRGADVVVNCVGIIYERRRGDFQRAHVDTAQSIAKACERFNVGHLVHISSIAAALGKSRYADSKRSGEEAVRAAFPKATILRPSIVFGPEDEFFNMFAGIARFAPALPLIGGGKTKFQPVYVADIAAAVMAAINHAPQIENPQGHIYELGGPEILTFKDIFQRLFAWTGNKRMLLPLSFGLAKIQASVLQIIPPKPILTPDQVKSLETDNVVSPGAMDFESLGIKPTTMDLIVPTYLERFRSGGRFFDKKSA